MILMTDGVSQSSSYGALVRQMAGGGVTLATVGLGGQVDQALLRKLAALGGGRDRKSTRLNSSHVSNSYAVFCLKKKIIQYILKVVSQARCSATPATAPRNQVVKRGIIRGLKRHTLTRTDITPLWR